MKQVAKVIQSNLAKATSKPPSPRRGGKDTPSNKLNVSWVPRSLHPKQDVDPFSRFYTPRPCDSRLTYAGIVDRNSRHLVYSMRPNNVCDVSVKVTGLMTQGRADGHEFVTSFLVSYSLDSINWYYTVDRYGNKLVRLEPCAQLTTH